MKPTIFKLEVPDHITAHKYENQDLYTIRKDSQHILMRKTSGFRWVKEEPACNRSPEFIRATRFKKAEVLEIEKRMKHGYQPEMMKLDSAWVTK